LTVVTLRATLHVEGLSPLTEEASMKTYHTTAPSGVKVVSEVPLDYVDSWWRFGYVSFAFYSYVTWGKKVRQALSRKPVAAAELDEQAQGKVGTL
jgi:hypothetical protein